MVIYPAIDIYEGKAVRLERGDYSKMTVYNDNPVAVARGFKKAGAIVIHVVDLEGARDGEPKNFEIIKRISEETGLFIQVGGGIRSEETIKQYLGAGIRRVVLGTAAVGAPGFMEKMVDTYESAIAIGVDIKEGYVAIKGWTEVSDQDVDSFSKTAQDLGVQTIICTDISKDGKLGGTNLELYEKLKRELALNIIASGGVSSLDDVVALSKLNLNGAIIGKALYTGDIDLKEAIKTILQKIVREQV